MKILLIRIFILCLEDVRYFHLPRNHPFYGIGIGNGIIHLPLGPNWTLLSGYSEGQTVSGKENYEKSVDWIHPLDLHYVCKGIQGWPKIILQVSCLDSLGRSWNVGYGCCSIPSTPGYHSIKVPCWIPAPTTLSARLKQYFIGGSQQLTHTDFNHLGSDRFKLVTQSKGDIEINIYVVLRNFVQFGVEYK